MQFLAPWAAAGVVLLAGPLLVHMLLRRHARRILFPAMRFLIETRAAAVRLHRPSDVALLIVRLGIAAAAIVASMQPLLLTPRRLAQWDARTIRAVIVDTSTPGTTDIDRIAEQEISSAFHGGRFAGADLRDALERAAQWFADAPPGRREVVILSDFQRGAIHREDLDVLPAGAGIRTVRTGTLPAEREVRLTSVAGFRGGEWQPSARLDQHSTAATWTKSADAPRVTWLTTAQAEDESDAASRAVDAAVSAGVAAGDDQRRVWIRFAGAAADPSAMQPVRTGWMVDATLALRRSSLLRQTKAALKTGERGGALVVETSVSAASIDAPAVVRAVVLAVRPAAIADREAEVVMIPDVELAGWRREASPFEPSLDRLNLRGESDHKWFWAIALLLLAVEGWLRRRDRTSTAEQVRHAA